MPKTKQPHKATVKIFIISVVFKNHNQYILQMVSFVYNSMTMLHEVKLYEKM